MNPPHPAETPQPQPWKGQWLGAIGLALLLSFSWVPNSYWVMMSWPWILWWQGGFLAFGIWLIWMLRQDKPFKLLGFGLDWAILAIFIVTCISGALSLVPGQAAWYIAMASGYGVVLYVVRNWIGNGWLTLKKLWALMSITGIVAAIVSLSIWHISYNAENYNLVPLGHHNFVGGYFVLMLPIALSYCLSLKTWWKLLALPVSGLFLYGVLSTQSRGALVGLLLWAVVSGFFLLFHAKPKHKLILISVALVLSLSTLYWVANHTRMERVIKFDPFNPNTPAIAFQADGQTLDRIYMWKLGLNILKDKPLLGVGGGNMSRVSSLYRPIESGQLAVAGQQLHNTPIQLAGELGLVGLGSILSLAWLTMGRWWKLYSKISPQNNFSHFLLFLGVGGSWVAYTGASLTDYQLENLPISLNLILNLSLLIALGDRYTNTIENLDLSRQRLLQLTCIAFTTFSLFVSGPETYALALITSAKKDFNAQNFDGTIDKLSLAQQLAPWDPTYALSLGFLIKDYAEVQTDPVEKQKTLKLAIEYWKDVLQQIPYDELQLQNVGILYEKTGSTEKALSTLETSIQLSPRDDNSGSPGPLKYLTLAKLYIDKEEYKKATSALAIQALTFPEILVSSIWSYPQFKEIQSDTIKKYLAFSDDLMNLIHEETEIYQKIYRIRIATQLLYKEILGQLPPILNEEFFPDDFLGNFIIKLVYENDSNILSIREKIKATNIINESDQIVLDLILEKLEENSEVIPSDIDILKKVLLISDWETFSAYGLIQSFPFDYRNLNLFNVNQVYTGNQEFMSARLLVNLELFYCPFPRFFPAIDLYLQELNEQELDIENLEEVVYF